MRLIRNKGHPSVCTCDLWLGHREIASWPHVGYTGITASKHGMRDFDLASELSRQVVVQL
jgi:hypothetical protein